jgi:hypothetical protein
MRALTPPAIGVCRTFFNTLHRRLPDHLSAFAGPFCTPRLLPMATESHETNVAGRRSKPFTNAITVKQRGDCGLRPACRFENASCRGGRTEPSAEKSMQEKTKAVRSSFTGIRRSNSPRAEPTDPPGDRREVAWTGERAADGRRSEIDRSCGLGKPRGGPCHHGDRVAPFAATPTPNDTLALVPRDRRGAGVGVAADLRRCATRLPHHTAFAVATAERSHAAGE